MAETTQDAMAAVTAAILQRQAPVGVASTVIYPYQQTPVGTTLVVRMIPQRGGSEVEIPWKDQYQHKLTFPGIIHSDNDTDDEAVVLFSGGATWGLPDPINADIKPLWDTNRDLAKRFYHTRLTLIPVLIVSSPIVEKVAPTTKGRVIKSGPQLTKALESALLNGGFDNVPWSWAEGRDAVIPVSNQGGFRHYSASFRGKVRAVPDAERLTDAELPDLAAIIGLPLSAEQTQLQWELYQDSRNGRPFDNAKYGRTFKAYTNKPTNGQSPGNGQAVTAAANVQPSAADYQSGTEQLAELRQRTASVRATAAE